jgi:hypothetical protein
MSEPAAEPRYRCRVLLSASVRNVRVIDILNLRAYSFMLADGFRHTRTTLYPITDGKPQ